MGSAGHGDLPLRPAVGRVALAVIGAMPRRARAVLVWAGMAGRAGGMNFLRRYRQIDMDRPRDHWPEFWHWSLENGRWRGLRACAQGLLAGIVGVVVTLWGERRALLAVLATAPEEVRQP